MKKNIFKPLFSKLGIHVIKRAKYNGSTQFNISDLYYDVNTPSANYAPWNGDTEFMKVYNEVKGHTLVDIYRCYELWELTEKVHTLDPEAHFIEIGVWRGGTASIIGKKLSLKQSKATFYLADTFTGVAKASERDTFYNGNEHSDTSQAIVEKITQDKYNHYQILTGIFPDETSDKIKPFEKFAFCHIDVDVYDSSHGIVNWIWDRMIVGGVIVFDDYGFHTCDGVTKYVNEQKLLSDRLVIHNINGHAIMIKLK